MKAKKATETEIKATKTAPARQPARGETADLDVRYGKIGISAVAAAIRYQRPAEKIEQPREADSKPRRIPEIAA